MVKQRFCKPWSVGSIPTAGSTRGWQIGYAADCKSVKVGSTPTPRTAKIDIHTIGTRGSGLRFFLMRENKKCFIESVAFYLGAHYK